MASFKVFTLALFAVAISVCSADFDERLVSANWAVQNQFPWQVSIKAISVPGRGPVFCSGSTIQTRWVLTSATCVSRASLFQVRYDSLLHYTAGFSYDSSLAYIHPFFNETTNQFNVALISVQNSVSASNILPFFPRALGNPSLTNSNALVTGWGRLTRASGFSPVLQFERGIIQSNTSPACRNNWNGSPRTDILCASFPAQPRCTGDTGSPLVVQVERRWYLVGVAVFDADSMACMGSATLFTPWYSFRQWVADVTQTPLI